MYTQLARRMCGLTRLLRATVVVLQNLPVHSELDTTHTVAVEQVKITPRHIDTPIQGLSCEQSLFVFSHIMLCIL